MYSKRLQPTLSCRFEMTVDEYPDRIAVVDAQQSLTYAELDHLADRVAFALRSEGVQGGLIGLSTGRSVDLIVGILGILKAGAAYVPLDPALPAARRRYIMEDSGVCAVLVDHEDHAVGLSGVPCVVISDATHNPALPRTQGDAKGLAYVIYTSGSTGSPKGVMIEHRQVLSLFDGINRVFDFCPDDAWLLFHSYAFDFSVWEIFGALFNGARLIVAPPAAVRSPDLLWKLIRSEKVTVLSLTPTYFSRLAHSNPGCGGGLRYVVFGGEALNFARLRGWYDRYGDTGPLLVNMYGITETTVHVTYRPLSQRDVTDVRSLIGKPLPHLKIELLDERLLPVAPGQVGEICIAGDGLARGYLGRDELTAERFVSDPGRAEGRLYRSGDLGRLLDNGELEYVGRKDQQVKIRGYRIELGEIQQCLSRHPAVSDVAVTTRASLAYDAQLVAYCVLRPGAVNPSPDEFREFLDRELPKYMIPNWFVSLNKLPINHNGKLDYSALPDPGAHRTPKSISSGPVHGVANTLLKIWQDVLEVDDISPTEPFQSVGGDSIRALHVVSAARSHAIPMRVDDLFRNPTIEALTAVITARKQLPDDLHVDVGGLLNIADRAALSGDVADAYPLTTLQTGMLFHGDDSTMYHCVSSATVNLALHANRLHECLRRIVQRHEALRTSFDLVDFSTPLQIVSRSADPVLAVDDLTWAKGAALCAAVQEILDKEKAEPLDWQVAPMVRFRAIALTPEKFIFVWSEHHAVIDGWSSISLFTDLIADYSSAKYSTEAKDTRDIPPLRDYVAAEREALASEEASVFWSGYLSDISSSSGRKSIDAEMEEAVIQPPAGSYRRLAEVARSAGQTPKAMLTAVAAAAVGLNQGLREVVIGHVTHGRLDRPHGEESLGLFLNTLPLRVDISGSWLDAARAVTSAEAVTSRYRRYPLAAIYRATGNAFRLDSLFNFTDFHNLKPLIRSRIIGDEGVTSFARTSFPLVVDVKRRQCDGEMDITVQFASPQWTAAARTTFVETLDSLLTDAIEHPEALVPNHL